jgi:hypothetical protein
MGLIGPNLNLIPNVDPHDGGLKWFGQEQLSVKNGAIMLNISKMALS